MNDNQAREPADQRDPLALAQQLPAALTHSPELCEIAAGLAAKIATFLSPCRHSADFCSVYWHGATYYFTALQSKAVRILWDAWRKGGLALRQEYILEEVGSDSGRLADLFRDNAAWGKLIIPGPVKGTFRLNEPTPNP